MGLPLKVAILFPIFVYAYMYVEKAFNIVCFVQIFLRTNRLRV